MHSASAFDQFDHDAERARLAGKLRAAGVSERVAEAMMQVPRDQFVPAGMQRYAWIDESLPIGAGQTISQPSLVGRMIDYVRPEPEHTVLDVGTGSGYQAAILSLLARKVVGVERISDLCRDARSRMTELGYANVCIFQAGDDLGWPELAPYDGIIVGAAAPDVPETLVEQLKIGGRLVIPVGGQREQRVISVQKTASGTDVKHHEYVRFVPLIGEGAWH